MEAKVESLRTSWIMSADEVKGEEVEAPRNGG
jgi:hypothetical protein